MIKCPHCLFLIVDPDLPSWVEIKGGMICPACFTDMSRQPRVPVTGAQVLVKYVVSILAGGTYGLLAMGVSTSVFADTQDTPGILAVVWLLIPVFLMVAIGNALTSVLEKTRSHVVRWLMLSTPLLLTVPLWLLAIQSMA